MGWLRVEKWQEERRSRPSAHSRQDISAQPVSITAYAEREVEVLKATSLPSAAITILRFTGSAGFVLMFL